MPNSKALLGLEIEKETEDRLKRLAATRQWPPHRMLNEAVKQYLDREEKREVFRQDTLNAWTEFQETGMHIDAAEAIAWLETWGEEDEAPPPECHK